jgi:hypothetical protein
MQIKFLQICHRFKLLSVYVCVAFTIVIVNFYKMGTIRFDIICRQTSLAAMEQRIVLCYIFQSLLEYFYNCVVGPCQSCRRYSSPSLLAVLQLSVLP